MRLNFTVGQQIAGGYAAVLLVIALLSIIGVRANHRFLAASSRVAHTYQVIIELAEIPAHLQDAESSERAFVITGQDALLAPFREAEAAFLEDLSQLRELLADDAAQQRRLTELVPKLEARMDDLRTVITARQDKGFEAAQQLISLGKGRQLMAEAHTRLDELRTEEQRQLEDYNRTAKEDSDFVNSLSEVGLLCMFFVLVATSVTITRRLRRQIGMAVEHVQSSSTELQAAATQQASGAREQASATTQVSATVRELLSTFRQIAGNAQQVAQAADETVGATRGGTQTVDRAQEAIETVRRQVDVIVNHMLELGKRSQEIGGILDIINELSEQTNILAINATIESAGAGEHGRRFAVVAEEIRKLADRVGASTKDVRSLIDEVRAAANTTLMATEDGSKAVQNSARQFAEVAGTFRRIAELTGANLDVARQIELSTQQQTSAVEQVNSAIQQVAVTAKQTEVSSSQTLQTSTHLIQLSRQLVTLVDARPSP